MSKRLLSIGFATVAAALALAGAASSDSGSTPTWVVLADNSLDTTAAQRSDAIAIVRAAADQASHDKGVLAAAPFQGNAFALRWRIDHRFAAHDLNSYYEKVDLMKQAEAVKQAASALFAHQDKRQGTDVIGGLLAASDKFRGEPDGPRTLVLVSNMWAQSPDDGLFLKKQALSGKQIRALVDRLARAGKVADLAGVCVYIVGAGTDAWGPHPTSAQLSMRKFWAAYLGRGRANPPPPAPTAHAVPSY